MYASRLRLQPVEERLPRKTEVRAIVVGRDAALVAPPDAGGVPVRLELGGELVRATRGRAAGKHDLAAHARGLGKQLCHLPGRGLLVVRDDQLDVPRLHGAPAASSRDRSIAASSAAANAAAPSRGGNHVSPTSPLLLREYATTRWSRITGGGTSRFPPSPLPRGNGDRVTVRRRRAPATAPSPPGSRSETLPGRRPARARGLRGSSCRPAT